GGTSGLSSAAHFKCFGSAVTFRSHGSGLSSCFSYAVGEVKYSSARPATWCANSCTKTYGAQRESAATVPYRLKMPPPPYVDALATISTRSYGACEATSRKARLSNVRMYRSDPNASYVEPTGDRRWIPSDGRELPHC